MKKLLSSFIGSFILAGAFAAVLAAPAEAQTTGGPFQYYAVTPCRFVDTRPGLCPGGAPTENCPGVPVYVRSLRTFTVKGLCGVPADAKAVSINATITLPTTFGDFRFYPTGGTSPLVSTINFTPSDLALANGAIVPLAAAATLDMTTYLNSPYGTTGVDGAHLILDVTGYFK
ncbi:MAG: hypothetical protein JNK60_18010 [Acidobacteria bacterium]|nr:hypothetical protein [Acidobacteriota bacterium]